VHVTTHAWAGKTYCSCLRALLGFSLDPPQYCFSSADALRQIMMLVHCPSPEFFPSLENNPGLQPAHLQAALVVHWSAISVLSLPGYRTWMGRFSPETRHVLVCKELCAQPLVFTSAARNHYKTQKLDSTVFPFPWQQQQPNLSLLHGTLSSLLCDLVVILLIDAFTELGLDTPNVVLGEPLLKFTLSPIVSLGFDRTEVLPPFDPAEGLLLSSMSIRGQANF
jgi:hypothetical protein